jgi:Tfp pilus assembly protein PilN
MIRINLLGGREVEEASSRRKEGILFGGGLGAILAGIALGYFSQQSTLSALDENITVLQTEMTKIRQQNQELKIMEEHKKETENKLKVVGSLTSKERRAAPVHVLDDLSSSAPEYLWLTEFAERGGVARINGRAVDNQTIAAFANDLAKSRYFQRVEIRETAQEDIKTTPARPAAVGRQAQSQPQPQIPVKRFLIETTINYLPGITLQPGTSEGNGAERGKEEGK